MTESHLRCREQASAGTSPALAAAVRARLTGALMRR